jgi:two-component system chemotaxis response regulator CheV
VGSNLFELIEFTVTAKPLVKPRALLADDGAEGTRDAAGKATVFAVNVAKVREVIRLPDITPCLTNTPEVLGVFNLRGVPIPAIHLAAALGLSDEPVGPGAQVIVTEFSRRVAGFVVSSARRIRRVSWDKVLPPSSEAFSFITGMMLVENQEFIFILDFERLLLDVESRRDGKQVVSPAAGGHSYPSGVNAHPGYGQGGAGGFVPVRGPGAAPRPLVLVVDDSSTARRALIDFLRQLDVEVSEFTNGEQAWSYVSTTSLPPSTIMISDVEMPRLDGYSLVKRMREHAALKGMPIILHSSLTGEANRDRAVKAGADAYVSKFNKKEILEALREALPGLALPIGAAS